MIKTEKPDGKRDTFYSAIMKFIEQNKSFIKLAAICAAGIILNLIGLTAVKYFNLRVYLDTIGTIFIAALGGYVPGIAVGFFTNMLGSVMNNSKPETYFNEQACFGIVSILVAIIVAFFAKKGYYKKFSKVILIIPLLVLVASVVGALIEEILKTSNTFDSWRAVTRIFAHIQYNFFKELLDKGFGVILSFFVLKLVPPAIQKDFQLLGKMQAPLSDEMRRAMNDNKHFKFISSLRTKMIVNLMSITLFVAIIISVISYTIYQESAVEERKRIADGIVSMVVSELNPNRMDEFLEFGHAAEGYSEVERNLYRIRASNSDIKFLYVYKVEPDGCHVIFDLDTATIQAKSPGDIEDFEEDFMEYVPALLEGRPIPPIINNDKYGYLLTIYKPVYNHSGQCVCYAGLDFSMDSINDYSKAFITKVIVIFSGILIFILVVGFSFIENNIILPVNTMAYCARNFAYDSEAARSQSIEHMRKLDIKTHDEIENLYAAFLKTTSDTMNYLENLKLSEVRLAVMDALAHRDALTGLKNKVAYNEELALLNADIADSQANFAIIMIDVNFLKRVNDTYGHERGNEYLVNAAKLACNIFGEERIYRIGGDEFVVVLDGVAVEHCDEKVSKLRTTIENFRSDKNLQPWEKVSAAVGVAYYEAGTDKNADEVFKRADAQMYANKLAMKANRRD